jgi:hypothetical protein
MKSLRGKVILGFLAVIVVVGAGVAWIMLPPHALSFAGGNPVQLEDYKGPSPVGVPAELRAADIVGRGAYLAKAADCEVCHTAEDGRPYAGGRALKTQFGCQEPSWLENIELCAKKAIKRVHPQSLLRQKPISFVNALKIRYFAEKGGHEKHAEQNSREWTRIPNSFQ